MPIMIESYLQILNLKIPYRYEVVADGLEVEVPEVVFDIDSKTDAFYIKKLGTYHTIDLKKPYEINELSKYFKSPYITELYIQLFDLMETVDKGIRNARDKMELEKAESSNDKNFMYDGSYLNVLIEMLKAAQEEGVLKYIKENATDIEQDEKEFCSLL